MLGTIPRRGSRGIVPRGGEGGGLTGPGGGATVAALGSIAMQTRQPIPTYFGRYQVLEELGSGAMGVVYLCVDPRLARPVAVKVIRESDLMTAEEKEQFLARFRNEAEAAGRLTHPGIVQIYDIGPSYLVMEYLDGKALSAVLTARHAYTVQEVCSIVLQVSDAIDYAHKHGIVHRDI